MIRDTLAHLSGKSPSRRGAESLEHWLLPGEPIEGALRGHVRYQPAWYVLTPTKVLLFRDKSGSPTVKLLPLGQIAGWQCDERIGNHDFLLTTDQGLVELRSVNPRYAVAFSHSLTRAGNSLVNGVLDWTLPYTSLFHELCDLMPAAWGQPLNPGTAEVLVAGELMATITGLLAGDRRRLSFGVSGLLTDLCRVLDPHGYNPAPRDLLMETLKKYESTHEEAPAAVFLDAAAERLDPRCAEAWSRVFALISEFIRVAASLLPTGVDHDCLESFAAAQGAYAVFSHDVLPPADRAPIGSAPDVIGELTRLQSLRDGGALSDDEFELLKARLLAQL